MPKWIDPPCGQYVAVTVQIPFELQPFIPGTFFTAAFADLVVSEGGVPGNVINLSPVLTQVHVVNRCDINLTSTLACNPAPMVVHADGSLVSAVKPAEAGEEVAMYAVGLGAPTVPVDTGGKTPSEAPATAASFLLNFDYRVNAPPLSRVEIPPSCSDLPDCPIVHPLFTGLTPGFAGLYQINFIVPPPPPGTPACEASIAPGGIGALSNLTVSLISNTSFDGAPICVDVTGR